MRQDDHHEDGQPPGGAHQRAGHDRRRGRGEPAAGRAAAADRVRHPAGRPLPAPHRGRQRGRRPPAPGLAGGPDHGPHRGAPGPGGPRAGHLRVALSRGPVRRRASAGGRGPGHGRRPHRPAHGRAVRRGGPHPPRAAPERVPPAPGPPPQDDRVRHPRRGRGDQDGRPDRHPPGRRGAGPVRHPGPDPGRPGQPVRRALRGGGPRPQAPVAGPGARPAARPTPAGGGGRLVRRRPPAPGRWHRLGARRGCRPAAGGLARDDRAGRRRHGERPAGRPRLRPAPARIHPARRAVSDARVLGPAGGRGRRARRPAGGDQRGRHLGHAPSERTR